MSSSEKVNVKMARGGYISLVVEGRVYPDSDGAGRKWTEVEIEAIKWPGGGEVAEKNIADMTQVQEAFAEAVEGTSAAAYEAAWERAHDR
jgi:hypothetical protein